MSAASFDSVCLLATPSARPPLSAACTVPVPFWDQAHTSQAHTRWSACACSQAKLMRGPQAVTAPQVMPAAVQGVPTFPPTSMAYGMPQTYAGQAMYNAPGMFNAGQMSTGQGTQQGPPLVPQ
jgi:hypothetical protein